MTREVHEEYAVQRWPETKRLLGLLVNSSGGAHARNARRLVHAARQQDRRLAAALLAAALPHTAEAGEVVNGARTRMSRKPAALARELLRNFPKGKGKSKRRRRRKPGAGEAAAPEAVGAAVEATGVAVVEGAEGAPSLPEDEAVAEPAAKPARARRTKTVIEGDDEAVAKPARARRARTVIEGDDEAVEKPAKPARARRTKTVIEGDEAAVAKPVKRARRSTADEALAKPAKPPRARRAKAAPGSKPAPKRRAKPAPSNPLEAASERVRAAVREASERPVGDEAA
jgi:ribonuclease E